MEVSGQRHAPANLPPEKTRKLGGPPGPVWTSAENLATLPPGFDPRTVQPVVTLKIRPDEANFSTI